MMKVERNGMKTLIELRWRRRLGESKSKIKEERRRRGKRGEEIGRREKGGEKDRLVESKQKKM